MENGKVSPTNLFQFLLSAEILSECKIEFTLPYLLSFALLYLYGPFLWIAFKPLSFQKFLVLILLTSEG